MRFATLTAAAAMLAAAVAPALAQEAGIPEPGDCIGPMANTPECIGPGIDRPRIGPGEDVGIDIDPDPGLDTDTQLGETGDPFLSDEPDILSGEDETIEPHPGLLEMPEFGGAGPFGEEDAGDLAGPPGEDPAGPFRGQGPFEPDDALTESDSGELGLTADENVIGDEAVIDPDSGQSMALPPEPAMPDGGVDTLP